MADDVTQQVAASIVRDDLTARLILLLDRVETRLGARKADHVHDERDLVGEAVAAIAGEWAAASADVTSVMAAARAWEEIYDRHAAELERIVEAAIARATPVDAEARGELASIAGEWLDAYGRTLVSRLVTNADPATLAQVPDWFGRMMQPLLRRMLSLGVMYHAAKAAGWDPAEHPRGKTSEESTPGSFAPASAYAEPAPAPGDVGQGVYGGLPWPPKTDAEIAANAEVHATAVERIMSRTRMAPSPRHREGEPYEPPASLIAQRQKDLQSALMLLSTPMVKAIADNLRSVLFHETLEDVDLAFDREGARRMLGTIYAYFRHDTGVLHVDGPTAGQSAVELAIHELAHAADSNFAYSARSEWAKVWQEEIVPDKVVSAYAVSNPAEGFAESIRALVTRGREFRTFCPKSWTLLRKWGLA